MRCSALTATLGSAIWVLRLSGRRSQRTQHSQVRPIPASLWALRSRFSRSWYAIRKYCCALAELSLWGSSVTDKGATALADGLRTNSTLKQLWLGECEGVTDEGANALKTSLSANTTLEQLGLICTQVSDALQDEIEGLAQSQRVKPPAARVVNSQRAKELVALARVRS